MPHFAAVVPMSEAQGKSRQPYEKDFGESAPENYERYFVPMIGAPLANELLGIAAIRPGEHVLDVACGTGIVTRLASQRVGPSGTVAGLDVNSGMLAVARSVTPPGTLIEWHEASAERMPLPDSSFDAVLCQMGLQFMPDKPAALREMHRVTKPGGRLILNVPGPAPRAFAIMGEALARHIGPEASGFVNHVFSLHDTTELQTLVSGAGFRNASTRAETKPLRLPPPREFLWQYVRSTPLAAVVAQADDECRASLERDVVGRWQEFVEGSGITFQVRVVVATAQKEA
jgi:ubiquinone/menaquinone biosynthesis C-methylase UbiE